VKILFLLRHPLYLRNYESVLRELAGRGHRVELIFSWLPKEVDRTLLDALEAEFPDRIVEAPLRPRTGWWWPVSDALRMLRDYLRYLEPAYARAPLLVARGARRLPPQIRLVFEKLPLFRSLPVRRLTAAACRLLDRAIPADPGMLRFLRRAQPDLLMVTPMIDFLYGQTDAVKAARALGIPTLLGVASWDNLTNKGLVQVQPDRTLVWNEAQVTEAVEMHRLDRETVRATGAQLFDEWFERRPSVDRAGFCARVGGLDPAKPILLYLCSSTFICRDEVSFVREWLAALRASPDPKLREANVVVRPHPSHFAQWKTADLRDFGAVRVWPDGNGVPVDEERKRDYFDSLHFADAVIGINTSGFIEAGIVGRRTLTLRTKQFAKTQDGTLHFRYLTEGGLLTVARDFDTHLEQLGETLADPAKTEAQVRAFVESFVRPQGLDRPATPLVVAAVEEAGALQPRPRGTMPGAALVRALLAVPAFPVRRIMLERSNPGMWKGIERVEHPRFAVPRGQSTRHSEGKIGKFEKVTGDALAEIAKSDRPIVVGPWMSEVGFELLYWIPLLRWARQAYGLDPARFVVISRGGVRRWYGDLAPRYVDLFDLYSPEEYVALNEKRQVKSGMQKQKRVSGVEKEIVKRVSADLGLGKVEVLHPRLMYSGIYRYHWSQRSAMDHLLLHAIYEPIPRPEPGELEARLPEDFYAVRFYARESFDDSAGHQDFVRGVIERLLERASVVLLDTPFTVDDHGNVDWMRERAEANRHGNRLVQAAEWMTPATNLEVQTRIVARSRGFVGTYGGLSYLAPYLGKPSICFHSRPDDVADAHVNTALTVFRSFGVPFVLLTPAELELVGELI
jgi:hypothetical protein